MSCLKFTESIKGSCHFRILAPPHMRHHTFLSLLYCEKVKVFVESPQWVCIPEALVRRISSLSSSLYPSSLSPPSSYTRCLSFYAHGKQGSFSNADSADADPEELWNSLEDKESASAASALKSFFMKKIICFSISMVFFFIWVWIQVCENFVEQADDVILRTKTLAGHNLDPTPWHVFPPKAINEEPRRSTAYKAFQCSYLTCPSSFSSAERRANFQSSNQVQQCPEFFRWIHRDLEPWTKTPITTTHIAEAKKFAAFRVVIVGGKLYVDLYYDCVQSRAMFTIWGLLQMLKRYPGMVPDVDMMFDCMDKPILDRTEHGSLPFPLFRYCTTGNHFDIPFPDWSFWGWPETNLRPWNEEFQDIKQGSQAQTWLEKKPRAYWKGNPDVSSPLRQELLACNHSKRWGALIMRQNWFEEAKAGYEQSKLSNQCKFRYKIYAEGYAWSVSLKYILSCGSVTLLISPKYEDFFSRGLLPKNHYWPVSSTDLCPSIKFAVDWCNENPSEAQAIGQRGQNFMENLSMDRVYDYMFHVINEYSKLLDFKPSPPSSSLEVCSNSLLCLADPKSKQLFEASSTTPSPTPPCQLQPADSNIISDWIEEKNKAINDVETMKAQNQAIKDAEKMQAQQQAINDMETMQAQKQATNDAETMQAQKQAINDPEAVLAQNQAINNAETMQAQNQAINNVETMQAQNQAINDVETMQAQKQPAG